MCENKKVLIFCIISILISLASIGLIIVFVVLKKKIKREFYSGICDNPYDVEKYSDEIIKSKLNECGFEEDSEDFQFALIHIKRHNELRACHNAPPVLPNCELMQIAQDYADTMPNDHSKASFHDEWMGENLFWSVNWTPDGADPVNAWYEEIEDYDFDIQDSKNGNEVFHFTQLVWKETREIGVGLFCKKNKCWVTSNYFPGGNIEGDFDEQVQNLK